MVSLDERGRCCAGDVLEILYISYSIHVIILFSIQGMYSETFERFLKNYHVLILQSFDLVMFLLLFGMFFS